MQGGVYDGLEGVKSLGSCRFTWFDCVDGVIAFGCKIEVKIGFEDE